MNFFRSIAATLFFVALFAVSTFAQTGAAAAPAGGMKIGLLDTGAFGDEKAGITRYVSAYKQLQTELKPRIDKLNGMQTNLNKIQTDLQNLQKQSQTANSPVSAQTVNAKVEEGETLQLQFKQEKESYDVAAGRSYQRIVGPISTDISKAIQEYAKQKGFALILDLDKMIDRQSGSTPILALDQTADVTADFIKFYNARPAGTASTAAPK